MELYVFDSGLKKMKMVLTNQNIVEAHEVTQINTAGQLTFTATIKSDVDEKIETTDIVFVKVKDDRYHPYKIVQSNMPTPNTIQYTCIEYAYYLFAKDGLVHDSRPDNWSVAQTISKIVQGTNWKVGYVDSSLPAFTGNFYWQTRTDCFKALVEGTGAELEFYMTMANNQITSRTIEAYKQRGTDTHQRFTYGMNALEVIAEEDATNAVTKVYPRGSGEMYTSDGEGQRKLTISDVEWSKAKGDPTDKPKGQDYLVYGSAKYDLDNGNQPSSIVEFQDEKDADNLINRAFEWLKQNNRPKVQFKAKVSDTGDLKLGDRVVIDREDLGIKYVTRVFKLDRNLLNEKLNTIELGDVVVKSLNDTINSVVNSGVSNIVNQIINNSNNSLVDANGNRITYGPSEPVDKKKGDTWYKPGDIVDGIQQYDVYVWDGEKWVLIIGSQLQNELLAKIEQAQKDTEEAKQQAQDARDQIDKIEKDFNDSLSEVENSVIDIKDDLGKLNITVSNSEDKLTEVIATTNGLKTTIKNNSDGIDRVYTGLQTALGAISRVEDKTNKNSSKISQLSTDINLSVKKGDVINQINVSTEGILIDGKKVHITGQTMIDNAVITSAMIKDISADKITTGTLNAANIKVVNLDVNTLSGNKAQFLQTLWSSTTSYSKIDSRALTFYAESSTGTAKPDDFLEIRADKMTWKSTSKQGYQYLYRDELSKGASILTLGAITNGASEPSKIRIKSSGNTNFVAANKSVRLSGDYVMIGSSTSDAYGSSGSAQAFKDLTKFANGGYTDSNTCYAIQMQCDNKIILSVNKNDVGNNIEFAMGAYAGKDTSTRLVYNNDNSYGMFLVSLPTYKRTYSNSSNMFITSNGYIGRSTSAKKYKQDIEYIDNLEEAKRTLEIQPAEWADKKQMTTRAKVRAKMLDEENVELLRRRYIGFIADDFADKGFEKLIIRDDTGEVEEFQYDRLSVYHHQMIKDLYNQIDMLKDEIKELKGDN